MDSWAQEKYRKPKYEFKHGEVLSDVLWIDIKNQTAVKPSLGMLTLLIFSEKLQLSAT